MARVVLPIATRRVQMWRYWRVERRCRVVCEGVGVPRLEVMVVWYGSHREVLVELGAFGRAAVLQERRGQFGHAGEVYLVAVGRRLPFESGGAGRRGLAPSRLVFVVWVLLLVLGAKFVRFFDERLLLSLTQAPEKKKRNQ